MLVQEDQEPKQRWIIDIFSSFFIERSMRSTSRMVSIKYNYVVDKQNRMKEMEETPKIIHKRP